MAEHATTAIGEDDATGVDGADGRTGLGRRAILAGLAGAAAVTVASGSTPAAATSSSDQGPLQMGSNSFFKAADPSSNTPNVSLRRHRHRRVAQLRQLHGCRRQLRLPRGRPPGELQCRRTPGICDERRDRGAR